MVYIPDTKIEFIVYLYKIVLSAKCLADRFPLDYIKFIFGECKGNIEVLPRELPLLVK